MSLSPRPLLLHHRKSSSSSPSSPASSSPSASSSIRASNGPRPAASESSSQAPEPAAKHSDSPPPPPPHHHHHHHHRAAAAAAGSEAAEAEGVSNEPGGGGHLLSPEPRSWISEPNDRAQISEEQQHDASAEPVSWIPEPNGIAEQQQQEPKQQQQEPKQQEQEPKQQQQEPKQQQQQQQQQQQPQPQPQEEGGEEEVQQHDDAADDEEGVAGSEAGRPVVARARTSLKAHFEQARIESRSGSVRRIGSSSGSSSSIGISIGHSSRRRHHQHLYPNGRIVFINDPAKTSERSDQLSGSSRSSKNSNRVRTSKYTLLSFVPMNLFEQLRRAAYVYFLAIVVLNQIPQLAVFGRLATAMPLLFVLLVTAVKDGYEDWRRHRSDAKENDRAAMVWSNAQGSYAPKRWKHIRAGEVVKVQANETIPCDLVLLRTSDPGGLAYVQTINLDGESNLKTRYARPEMASIALDDAHHHHHHHQHHHHHHPPPPPHSRTPMTTTTTTRFSGAIVCEKPNRNIYGFTAFAELDGGKAAVPLAPSNVILRGCELKNTAWAVGVAVYTGQETKVMLNNAGARSKSSRLERRMNRETIWLSVFLFGCCFSSGLGMGLWLKRHESQLDALPYYGKTKANVYGYYGVLGESVFAFLSSLISLQIMIPISLYISMELVRLGQSYFMINDAGMYHAGSDTRLQCRDLSISEDLGQVRYIFSDKTGTLTENKMELRRLSVFGDSYGVVAPPRAANDASTTTSADPVLLRILQDPTLKDRKREAIHDFLLTLSACNTVVPTKVSKTTSGALEMEIALGTDDAEETKLEYQGESPDEVALVSAAASYGYTLLSRTSSYLVLNVLGDIQRLEILGMHEFDSVRKCMSVVVKCPDGVVRVLAKGADSAMLKRAAQIEGGEQPQVELDTQKHLAEYAEQGLRTLVVGARRLSSAELERWQQLYGRASASLSDRAQLLRAASDCAESSLTLLGATGIEDKLQDGVPDAIATLREAGIKIWVLTGDKQETAISVGLSCALLTSDMKQIVINEPEREACREAVRDAKAAYARRLPSPAENRQQPQQNSLYPTGAALRSALGVAEISPSSDSGRRSNNSARIASGHLREFSGHLSMVDSESLRRDPSKNSLGSRELALIIDGNSLVHALEPDFARELYELATACKVVICCRVAPLQKAGIVSLVKRLSREMTLAIGDGANDVSMIQMADIGIGINGQEGRQAVLASDYALSQFRFLKRLLLVHGHLNYERMGSMILYNFYRNAIFVMLLFWYMLHSAFSSSPPITQWSLVLYSIIYTSLPTIVVAMLDRGLDPGTLLKYPALYKAGQRNDSYNKPLFWVTMLDTLWQSLVLFYVPFLTYQQSTIDIWSLGSLWTIAIVVLVNVHLAMDVQHFTWIIHAVFWVSIAATYACVIALDVVNDETQAHYWVFFHVITASTYWLDIVLVVILALLPRFVVKVAVQRFKPSDCQIARENEILA